jgi:cytochrome c
MLLAAAVATAESPGLGVPLDDDEVAALDFTVMPDGSGLPPGSGTVTNGATVFATYCIACHGQDASGSLNDALVGGQGSLATGNPQKTIGSYWPYATTVFSYIRRAMPLQSPGLLSDDEIYAVTAYLLYLNGIIGEDETMDAETLPLVKMPNSGGFSWAWEP